MTPKVLTDRLSVSSQLSLTDIDAVAAAGFDRIINNRPDGEEPGQPFSAALATRAAAMGLDYHHIPVVLGAIRDADVVAFADAIAEGRTLAFCRSGTRATTLWTMTQARGSHGATPEKADVVIVGGGSAGIATAASLLARDRTLNIVVIEPRDAHDYQPGWTMVGGGVFECPTTRRPQASVTPKGVRWIRGTVADFAPAHDHVMLEDGSIIGYRVLVVAPGITLDWSAIDGLADTLGRNGVTSNYSYATAPYTWQLVQDLREGVALFTQPPMPIKCAGAPQKAMYLSCDHWRRQGRLKAIDVEFHTAGAVLFGVNEYVPALMAYVERYGIDLNFGSTLIAVDGAHRTATFREAGGEVTKRFDMLHVTPPQVPPPFVARSALANAAGYVDVDRATLRHVIHANVFGLGDGGSTPNAKTMAAARKQAPIVAENVIATLKGKSLPAAYDGYGSCPLTVERGRIVLAEFGYDGVLLPSFPKWLVDGTKPQRLSWLLKSEVLPQVYWQGMLKGREWMAKPARFTEPTVA